jgi:predicted GIY-YIG superfamily endonuclease
MYYVYLLASKPHGTLYIGTTSDLGKRDWKINLLERDNPHSLDLFPGLRL